jgi:16S rRNA (guanine966-N2)-methyltransferase
MRIVAGEWRGRKLKVPAGAVRPTADRVRAAWMSIVHALLPGANVLDLCAGSGALGIEALSRGAQHATFVESSDRVVRTLRENLALVGADDRSTVIRMDAAAYVARLASNAFDVAFVDPPYTSGVAHAVAERWLQAPFARIIGIEHSSRDAMPGATDTRRYGDTAITFYRVADPASPLA